MLWVLHTHKVTKVYFDKNGGSFLIRKASLLPRKQSRFEKRQLDLCFCMCIYKREVLVEVHQTYWFQRLLFPVKVTFFSISNIKCKTGSPLVLRLCPLGSGRALIYDELYIELNDVKGANFCSIEIYMINIKNNSVDGLF